MVIELPRLTVGRALLVESCQEGKVSRENLTGETMKQVVLGDGLKVGYVNCTQAMRQVVRGEAMEAGYGFCRGTRLRSRKDISRKRYRKKILHDL